MKRTNKKGFTTVELVIVIAVIAILATVLIPTFSGLIEKAHASSALQEANSAVKYIALENLDGDTNKIEGDLIIKIGSYYFGMIDGQLVEATKSEGTYTIEAGTDDYTFTVLTGDGADLQLGEDPYTAEKSNVAVDDLDSTKVEIYTLTETPNA